MELKITDFALSHLVESVEFTLAKASVEKREAVIDKVLEATLELLNWPHTGQIEVLMEGREFVYRRLIVGHFKVIYRIEGQMIYVTDIFDSRQHPSQMAG